MVAHPSDHACLEWAREGRLRFAPDPAAEAAAHFATCADCQARVQAFAALDRAYAPDEALEASDRVPKSPPAAVLLALLVALVVVLAVAL